MKLYRLVYVCTVCALCEKATEMFNEYLFSKVSIFLRMDSGLYRTKKSKREHI